MPDDLYKIVVQGPSPDRSPEEVKTRVAALFGGNVKKAASVLAGKPVVVKRGLDKKAAVKYKQAFEKAGAVVKVFADKGTADAPAKPAPRMEPAPPPLAASAPEPEPPAPPVNEALARAQAEYRAKMAAQAGEEAAPPAGNKALAEARAEHRARAGGGEAVPGGAALAMAASMVDQEDREPIQFFTEAPKAVIYPLQGHGISVIVGGVVIFTVASYIPFIGFIVSLIISAYLAGYMFRVINSTADGDDRPPHWPDMSDVFPALLKYLWVCLACFIPALLYAIFVSRFNTMADPIFYVLVLGGAAYWPMALLTVAMSGNFLALNPMVVVPAILRMPADYAICLIAFLLVLGVNALFRSVLVLPIHVIGPAIGYFLSIYFMMVEMRILGLLYLAHEDDLNWYS